MGQGEDAVVDHELKAHGVEDLRIANLPNLIGGKTNAPAMMIGEKLTDLIRQGS